VFAAALGVAMNSLVSAQQMGAWGWRLPFLLGCLIVPFLFYFRRAVKETEAFHARKRRPDIGEIVKSMGTHWRLMVAGMGMVMMTTVSFYLVTAYTPTFGKEVLKLSSIDSLIVTACVGLSNFVVLPLAGALSDRIGRRPLLFTLSALAILTAYPTMQWLVAEPSFIRLLTVELWLSLLYAGYNGALVVALTEVMPVDVRTTGFSLAYSLATMLGGFTPAISTYLIHATGDRAAPGIWMSVAGVCGLVATFAMYRTSAAKRQFRTA